MGRFGIRHIKYCNYFVVLKEGTARPRNKKRRRRHMSELELVQRHPRHIRNSLSWWWRRLDIDHYGCGKCKSSLKHLYTANLAVMNKGSTNHGVFLRNETLWVFTKCILPTDGSPVHWVIYMFVSCDTFNNYLPKAKWILWIILETKFEEITILTEHEANNCLV